MFSGVFLAWTTIIGHNFFHMRDNFRMYYFDLSLMSSKDWRISHVMSHHTYPNTLWDFEMYAIEPFVSWLPDGKKARFWGFISQLVSPLLWTLIFYEQGVKRFVWSCTIAILLIATVTLRKILNFLMCFHCNIYICCVKLLSLDDAYISFTIRFV